MGKGNFHVLKVNKIGVEESSDKSVGNFFRIKLFEESELGHSK